MAVVLTQSCFAGKSTGTLSRSVAWDSAANSVEVPCQLMAVWGIVKRK